MGKQKTAAQRVCGPAPPPPKGQMPARSPGVLRPFLSHRGGDPRWPVRRAVLLWGGVCLLFWGGVLVLLLA